MGFNIGPRVLKATGGSIHRSGNYRIHQFPPQHVTDNLIMHLDAGDPRSYYPMTSGNVWTDLSGCDNHGTWNAAPVWSRAKGGTMYYGTGSTNRTCSVPIGGIKSRITNTVTCEIWLGDTAGNTSAYRVPLMATQDNNWSKGFGFFNVSGHFDFFVNDFDGSNSITSGTNAAAATRVNVNSNGFFSGYTHWVGTYDGWRTRLYKNGVLLTSTTSVEERDADYIDFGTSDYLDIGHANTAYHYHNGGTAESGDVGVIRVYNRALSATEVVQNYNAEKVRYAAYTDNFTPTCAGSGGKIETLVVGGGGGAGDGGGGAGGLIYNSAFSVTNGTAVAVTVGSGGTGAASGNGSFGTDTTFGSLTAVKGGFGGGGQQTNGGAGGSGGGSSGAFGAASGDGASGTAGQGNAGGVEDYTSGSVYAAGGGGGAGSAGGTGNDTSPTTSGLGGAGLAYNITGESKFYAAGGGSAMHNGGFSYSPGGSGIGGNLVQSPQTAASDAKNGGNAVPDTGSGGGGGKYNVGGGDGANGIVVARYPAEDYNVEALIIGGGGSGGSGSDYAYSGGGGGAGGLIYYSNLSISSGKNYKVHIGNGGKSSPSNTYHSSNNVSGLDGFNGKNTIFDDKIAIGGGFGGGGLARAGNSGGSGGGSGGRNNSGGKGTPTQGHDGGDSSEHGDTTTRGGGGGGAGSAGGDGSNTVNGTFGDGLEFSITGSSVTYAQGGGGGYLGTTQAQTPGQGGRGANGDGGATSEPNTATGAWDGAVYIAYKGPQRGEGGTIDQTSRPGYTIHKFTSAGPNLFIG